MDEPQGRPRAHRARARRERLALKEEYRAMVENWPESLREARDAAEAASRELEAFSYSVAHDLRAPLRGMSGFAQVLLEDYGDKLDAEGVDCLDEICTNARKMAALVDALLVALAGEQERGRARARRPGCSRPYRRGRPGCRGPRAPRGGRDRRRPPRRRRPGARRRVALQNLLANAWKFNTRSSRPGSSPARARRARSSCATTAPASTWPTRGGSSRPSSACTARATSGRIGPATARGGSCCDTEVESAEGAIGSGATFHFTLASEPQERTA